MFYPMRLWDCYCYELFCFRWLNYSFVWMCCVSHSPYFLEPNELWIFFNWKYEYSVLDVVSISNSILENQSNDHLLQHLSSHKKPNLISKTNYIEQWNPTIAMRSNNCFNKCKKFTSTTLNVIVHMPYFNRAKIYLESISLRVMKLFSHRKTNGNVGCMHGPNLWCGVEWQNWLN